MKRGRCNWLRPVGPVLGRSMQWEINVLGLELALIALGRLCLLVLVRLCLLVPSVACACGAALPGKMLASCQCVTACMCMCACECVPQIVKHLVNV